MFSGYLTNKAFISVSSSSADFTSAFGLSVSSTSVLPARAMCSDGSSPTGMSGKRPCNQWTNMDTSSHHRVVDSPRRFSMEGLEPSSFSMEWIWSLGSGAMASACSRSSCKMAEKQRLISLVRRLSHTQESTTTNYSLDELSKFPLQRCR